jgi:hypothetical protein
MLSSPVCDLAPELQTPEIPEGFMKHHVQQRQVVSKHLKDVSSSVLPTVEEVTLSKKRKHNITKFVPQSSRLFFPLFP